MKLVVDTNELFSFFNRKSKAREISLSSKIELFSPIFALKEIEEKKSKILKNFSLSEEQFLVIKLFIGTFVKFIDAKEYAEFLLKAEKLSPDLEDVDFFALSLKLDCPLWSEDALLKSQKEVKILSVSDLLKSSEIFE